MSEHRATITWARNTDAPFTVEEYTRDHRVAMETGLVFPASSAPAFKGNPSLTNPEELLVSAISSCHMLTFLAVAAKKGFVVERYEDEAVGTLERPEGGRMQIARCTLRPLASFSGKLPSAAELAELHEAAHRGCFIANSVKTAVSIEPR